MTQQDAASLLATIQGLTKRNELKEAVEEAERSREALRSRAASVEDAETCRLTMLACIDLGLEADASAWRVRGTARAAALGWGEGIMMFTLADVLGIVRDASASVETITGITVPAVALEAWDEALPFLEPGRDDPRHPDGPLLARVYWEKRGFMLCAREEYDAAIECYDRAAKFAAGTDRGALKVALGRALCVYLRGGAGRDVAVDETEVLLRRCGKMDQLQLAGVADRNLTAMRRGGRDVAPYELL